MGHNTWPLLQGLLKSIKAAVMKMVTAKAANENRTKMMIVRKVNFNVSMKISATYWNDSKQPSVIPVFTIGIAPTKASRAAMPTKLIFDKSKFLQRKAADLLMKVK